jgi:hypothetical protein
MHTGIPEGALSQFEPGDALMGVYSWGRINMPAGAKAIAGGAARLQSKGDISTAFDGVDQLCHKSPAASEVSPADFDEQVVLEESSFMLWRFWRRQDRGQDEAQYNPQPL